MMDETDHDALITIKTQVSQIKETLDMMEKKLMGNGSVGLCSIVLEHTKDIQEIKEEHDRQKADLKWGITAGFTIMTISIMILNYIAK